MINNPSLTYGAIPEMIIKSEGNLKLVLRWLTSYMKENIKPGGAREIVPNLFCRRWWFESILRGSIQSDFQVIVGLQLVFEDNWLKYLQNKTHMKENIKPGREEVTNVTSPDE